MAAKDDNGAYILYTEIDSSNLKVLEVDNEGKKIKTYDLKCQGKPYDIETTSFGFVFMARDEPHFLYVKAWDVKKDSQKWHKTIMNNGAEPTEAIDQINLGNKFGTRVMYKPHNGRLTYMRDKIFIVFAHYNFFGFKDDGSRNAHTGDSTVFLGVNDGENLGWAFNWGSSHSLTQRVIYDGYYLYTATLGDAFP